MSDARKEIDGNIMRQMEATAREIGRTISAVVRERVEKRYLTGPPRYGFMLMLFSFEGPECTYISNAERPEMIKLLEEFIRRQRAGEPTQLWSDRS